MVRSGLLIRSEGNEILKRPPITSPEFYQLVILGQILGRTFERCSIVISLLSCNTEKNKIERKNINKQCLLMARRISLLNGIDDPEFSNSKLFDDLIDLLIRNRYIEQSDDGLNLTVSEQIKEISEIATIFLSPDIHQSIKRFFSSHSSINKNTKVK